MTDDSDNVSTPKPVWHRRPVVALLAIILLAVCCTWWSLQPNATERRLLGNWRLENSENDGSMNVNRYRFDRRGLVLSHDTPGDPYVEAGFCWSARPGRLYITPDLSLEEKAFRWVDKVLGGQLGSGSTTSIYTFDWITDNEIQFTGVIEDDLTTEFDMVGFRQETTP